MIEQGGERPAQVAYQFISLETLSALFSPIVVGEILSGFGQFDLKREEEGETRDRYSRGRCHWNFAITRKILKRSRIKALGWQGLDITPQVEQASPSHKVGAIYRNGHVVIFDITPSQYAPLNPTLERDILLISCPKGQEKEVLAGIYGGFWQPVSFCKARFQE